MFLWMGCCANSFWKKSIGTWFFKKIFATCKCSNQVYVGKSQWYWKTRMQEHFRDLWKILERLNRTSVLTSKDQLTLLDMKPLLNILQSIVTTSQTPEKLENLYIKISNYKLSGRAHNFPAINQLTLTSVLFACRKEDLSLTNSFKID